MSANKPKTKAVKEWNFMDQELDDRKKKILKAIIKTYMETGEPVGSRTISKFADLNVSSATIRNEMSDLISYSPTPQLEEFLLIKVIAST